MDAARLDPWEITREIQRSTQRGVAGEFLLRESSLLSAAPRKYSRDGVIRWIRAWSNIFDSAFSLLTRLRGIQIPESPLSS